MIAVASYIDWPSFATGWLALILVIGWTIRVFRRSATPSRERGTRQVTPPRIARLTATPTPTASPPAGCREALETAESVAVRQLLTGHMDNSTYRAQMHELASAAGSTAGPNETTEM